jgi:broad specificity phosphatase PhoE
MGIFAGRSYEWAEAQNSYELDKSKRWYWTPPGGESYGQIAERLSPFFDRLPALATELGGGATGDGGGRIDVLVVTHAVTLRLVQATLEASLPVYPERLARNGEILEALWRGRGQRHQVAFRYYGSQTTAHE